MTPNLLDFIQDSKKIPRNFLDASPTKAEFKMWELLASHLFDFVAIFAIQMVLTEMISLAFENLIPTSLLRDEFKNIGVRNLGTTLLPLISLSYFFFCNFFNHGQTLGMKQIKKRIELPQRSFTKSFLWALKSTSLIFTCGLSIILLKEQYARVFVKEDHLYQIMMWQVEWKAPSLVDKTATFESYSYKIEWKKAA